MKEIILTKLGIGERGAFNILNDKELCDRIINETPIWIEDFIKEYNIPTHTLKRLLKQNIISSFSNSKNAGSKIFIFKEETLKVFKLNYTDAGNIFYNINRIIELYLLHIKNTITYREYEVIHDKLINNLSFDDISNKYNLNRNYVNVLFDKAYRRVKYSQKINIDYEKLKSEYEILKHEVNVLKQKRIALSKSKGFKVEQRVLKSEFNPILSQKIIDLNLSFRTSLCLKCADIETLGELVTLSKNDLLKLRNFGNKSLAEVEDLLNVKGLRFGMSVFII